MPMKTDRGCRVVRRPFDRFAFLESDLVTEGFELALQATGAMLG
jgi:hypothetical protein